MKPSKVSFPYEIRRSTVFGPLKRPVACVEFYSTALRHWIAYTMVVDTGADYCVLPASSALDLGIKLSQCEQITTSGVGGKERIFLSRHIRLRLGHWEITAPVGFVGSEYVPPLLGRYKCLDRFDFRLRNFLTTFSLVPDRPLSELRGIARSIKPGVLREKRERPV